MGDFCGGLPNVGLPCMGNLKVGSIYRHEGMMA